MKIKDAKKHRWMLAGTVYFKAPSEDPEKEYRFEVTLNAMVESTDHYINANRLGKAQQVLQMRAYEKLNNPDAVVVDVVLLSSSYLGCMTEAEWTFQPPVTVPENAPLAN